jgi:hypothetical protein
MSFLEACSSGDDYEETTNPNNGSGTGTGSGNGTGSGTGNTGTGFTVENKTYTIDLTHSNFSGLKSVGNWMNGKSLGIPALFLRISSTKIQAYTNVCPYHGRNNEWVLESANTFRCDHQQNRFSTDCDVSNSLVCYTSTLSGNTLTVTIN